MLELIARSTEYQVLHGMPYLIMSSGDKDYHCNGYPLATAMMMNYAINNDDVFRLTPKEDLLLIDKCGLKCVLDEAKALGMPMNMNEKYNSNLKLSKFGKVEINSLNDLFDALDKYKLLYSGIFDNNVFGGIELVAMDVEVIDSTSHAVIISSVGKFKNVPGLFAEVVNAWNNE